MRHAVRVPHRAVSPPAVSPQPSHAATVAGWSRSAEEAAAWVSLPEHPFPAAVVASWWEEPGVHARVLLDPDGAPVAYGEVWDDEEEDEVELARLIVDPARRRGGVGRLLVRELLAVAAGTGRASCFLRVAPGNAPALALYRAAGFRPVDPALAADWNRAQPVDYTWLEHPDVRRP